MVLDSARNIGVLKDLTKYGATFMPLDLNMEQKERLSCISPSVMPIRNFTPMKRKNRRKTSRCVRI